MMLPMWEWCATDGAQRCARSAPERFDARGRRSLALNLKQPSSLAVYLELCESAKIVVEGNHHGVMERLGPGPDVMHERYPKLVYGRVTNRGQFGLRARSTPKSLPPWA
jgi:alpha-methylacyl-CoA racemase